MHPSLKKQSNMDKNYGFAVREALAE